MATLELKYLKTILSHLTFQDAWSRLYNVKPNYWGGDFLVLPHYQWMVWAVVAGATQSFKLFVANANHSWIASFGVPNTFSFKLSVELFVYLSFTEVKIACHRWK